MSTAIHEPPAECRISIVDEDPLRARRDARELLAAITEADPEADPEAALDLPGPRAAHGADKGAEVTDVVGLVFSGAALVVTGVQAWLARVPQRTVIVTRPDGATLRISGRQARADDEHIARFLAGTADRADAAGTENAAGSADATASGEGGPDAE
ncbi:effector-associated constant component EACC1 [Streptomyces katsurahamanus]|uniref:effector-associated constant component EACC1 n=1 Tax=Streptomyces katsurahamanus TaxID=2577098 RepID=UPI001E60317E|nr:hypothetical protein [Streptomyces katsurahamanus]